MSRPSSSRHAVRIALVAVLLALTGVVVLYRCSDDFISYAQADGQITRAVSADGKTESWRIREPNVKQHVTPYPQIRFQPGDRVTIEAGGCVQTGGFGRTWKRYVNPLGPDATRLYYALIWIPSVIGGPAATGV